MTIKMISVVFICFLVLLIRISPIVAADYDFEMKSGLLDTGLYAGYPEASQNDPSKSPALKVGQAIGVLLSLVGIIFLGLMIYGGYTWMMSRGANAEVEKAKRMIEQAIIGLVIVFAAYAITYFVGITLGYSY